MAYLLSQVLLASLILPVNHIDHPFKQWGWRIVTLQV